MDKINFYNDLHIYNSIKLEREPDATDYSEVTQINTKKINCYNTETSSDIKNSITCDNIELSGELQANQVTLCVDELILKKAGSDEEVNITNLYSNTATEIESCGDAIPQLKLLAEHIFKYEKAKETDDNYDDVSKVPITSYDSTTDIVGYAWKRGYYIFGYIEGNDDLLQPLYHIGSKVKLRNFLTYNFPPMGNIVFAGYYSYGDTSGTRKVLCECNILHEDNDDLELKSGDLYIRYLYSNTSIKVYKPGSLNSASNDTYSPGEHKKWYFYYKIQDGPEDDDILTTDINTILKPRDMSWVTRVEKLEDYASGGASYKVCFIVHRDIVVNHISDYYGSSYAVELSKEEADKNDYFKTYFFYFSSYGDNPYTPAKNDIIKFKRPYYS